MADVPRPQNFFQKLREGVTNLNSQVSDLKSLVEANKRQASTRGNDCLRQFQNKVQDKHAQIAKLKSEVSTDLNFDDIEHAVVALEKRMNDFISGDHQHDESTFVKYNFPGSPPPPKIALMDSEFPRQQYKHGKVAEVADVTVEFTPGLTTKRPDSTKKTGRDREFVRPLKMDLTDDSLVLQREEICQPIVPLTPKTRSTSSRKHLIRSKLVEKIRETEPPIVSKALEQMQTSLGQSTPTQPIPTKELIKTAKLVRSIKKVDVGTPQLPSSSISEFLFNDRSRSLRPRK